MTFEEEEKKEIKQAERAAINEVRAWKRHISKKLNSMSDAEQVKYLNETGVKYCAKHGVNFSCASVS